MFQSNLKLILAVMSIIFLLTTGTLVYHFLEGWGWVDSFYFTGITMTTVGYGDLYPHHDATKIFSVLLAFASISIVFYSVSVIANSYFDRQQALVERRLSLIERRKARERQRSSILDRLEGRRGP